MRSERSLNRTSSKHGGIGSGESAHASLSAAGSRTPPAYVALCSEKSRKVTPGPAGVAAESPLRQMSSAPVVAMPVMPEPIDLAHSSFACWK